MSNIDITKISMDHLEEIIYEERVKLGMRVNGVYEDKHPDATGDGSIEFHDALLDELARRYAR